MGSDLENFSWSQLFSADLLDDCPHIVLCRKKKKPNNSKLGQCVDSHPAYIHIYFQALGIYVAHRNSFTKIRAGNGAKNALIGQKTYGERVLQNKKLWYQHWERTEDRKDMKERIRMCQRIFSIFYYKFLYVIYLETLALLSTPVWMQLVQLKDSRYIAMCLDSPRIN